MEIDPEHRQAVAEWIEDGLSLAEVQRKLSEDFKISMTYMDVRFLVDDLELSLKDPDSGDSEKRGGGGGLEPSHAPKPPVGAGGSVGAREQSPLSSSVRVEVDKLVKPGVMVSGSAVFSDGERAEWFVDQLGRLGFNPKTKGYRPGPEDLEAFQVQLQGALQEKGF